MRFTAMPQRAGGADREARAASPQSGGAVSTVVMKISSCVEELKMKVKSKSLFYGYLISLMVLDEAFS